MSTTYIPMPALHWAIKKGNVSDIQELVKGQYANPNQKNNKLQNALHALVEYSDKFSTEDFGMLVYLLNEYKVDTKHTDCYGSTPLQQAILYRKDKPLIVGLIATGGVRPTN